MILLEFTVLSAAQKGPNPCGQALKHRAHAVVEKSSLPLGAGTTGRAGRAVAQRKTAGNLQALLQSADGPFRSCARKRYLLELVFRGPR